MDHGIKRNGIYYKSVKLKFLFITKSTEKYSDNDALGTAHFCSFTVLIIYVHSIL